MARYAFIAKLLPASKSISLTDRGLAEHYPAVVVARRGERAACRFLQKKGLRFVKQNWRCRIGEIDLVFKDGDELVLVEVKTRLDSLAAKDDVFNNIDQRKAKKLTTLAHFYLLTHYRGNNEPPTRIDILGVVLARADLSVVSIEHLIAAI